MPNHEPPRVLQTRVRASYRARCCAAAIATGAQIFALGAGNAIPLCLNAAYLSALPAVLAAVLTAFLAQRTLAARQRTNPEGAPGAGMRVCFALLALALTADAVMLLAALAELSEQTLLPQAREIWDLGTAFAAAALCALSGGTGVARLCFALRYGLPILLLALSAAVLGSPSGLFPLLGTGLVPLGLSSLTMLGAASPALILLLPPPELHEAGEAAERCPVPGAWFFIWRVLLGALMGVVLLMALSACNPYETLAGQATWGQRLVILGSGEPRTGLVKTMLTLCQVLAFALSAACTLCASAEALRRAWAGLGRAALAVCLGVLAAALLALIAYGFPAGLAVAAYGLPPALLLPPVFLLAQRRASHRAEKAR